MAKIDYKKHQADFLNLRFDDPTLTVEKYCENVGLNYSSAKRYIKSNVTPKSRTRGGKGRKKDRTESEWSVIYCNYLANCVANPTLSIAQFAKSIDDIPATVRNGFKSLKNRPEFANLEQKREQAIAQFEASKPKKTPRKFKTPPLHKIAGDDPQSQALLLNLSTVKETDDRNPDGTFKRGNQCAVTHGAYAKATGLNIEHYQIAAEIDPVSLVNEVVAARAQYISMLNYIAATKQLIDERYENGKPITDPEGNVLPKESEIMKIVFGTSDKLRSLEISIQSMVATIAKVNSQLSLQRLKERESPALSPVQVLTQQRELLQSRITHEWTATETAKKFELMGLPIPDFLLIEARQELADYVPPVEEVSISEEELDRMSLEYRQQQQEVQQSWLPERREEIRKVFDEMDRMDAGEVLEPPAIDDNESLENVQDELLAQMDDAFADIAKFESLDDSED
ncbi:hypothetical protein ACN08L_16350 (plasmid) [Photobacterium leiognathi subsp. mandapamensis]|uniref:hypothetical protein n=1 Tax=Photobacterium leiognathi TaxID=553611 RepID=UPI003AF38B10